MVNHPENAPPFREVIFVAFHSFHSHRGQSWQVQEYLHLSHLPKGVLGGSSHLVSVKKNMVSKSPK